MTFETGDATSITERLRISSGGITSLLTNQAKTSTSNVEYALLGRTNESTNYSALQLLQKGGASNSVRSWSFQTIESGVANAGNIVLQPSGGNVGIGNTPSNAWADSRAIELGANGILWTEQASGQYNSLSMGLNFYVNSAGSTLYKSANVTATRYQQYQGSHVFQTAGTGTPNTAATFVDQLTISSGGDVAIGSSSSKGFLNSNGTAFELDVNRNPNTGVFGDTNKSHARIEMNGASGGSSIIFKTASANNTTATTKLTISSGGDATFEGLIKGKGGYQILNGATAYGGIYTYAAISGSGTDYNPTLFSEGNLYFATGGNATKKLTISSGGDLGIGFAGYSNYKVVIRGASATTSDYAFRTENSGTVGMLQNRNDGLFQTGDAPQSPYYRTTANSANTHVASNGALERSTASSKRFKNNIVDWKESGLNTILALKPKTFTYKKEHYFKPDRKFLGLIAEEVADVSGYLADYENEDGSGQIENVRYANIVVPLIKAIQEQQTIIDTLTARLDALEKKA